MNTNAKQLKISLVKSISGRLKNHQACVKGLGLRKLNDSVIINATAENMGMVNKVYYLLKVEEV
jgi:large subunit ribosomal protein L30